MAHVDLIWENHKTIQRTIPPGLFFQVHGIPGEEAIGHLLDKGFTAEYGAREMDRVIAQELKPMLMREILFGQLKQGGSINILYKDGSLSIG